MRRGDDLNRSNGCGFHFTVCITPSFLSTSAGGPSKLARASELPMRDDLAQDIRVWPGDLLKAMQDAARLKIGEPLPLKLPCDRSLFNLPDGLLRIFDRDLVAAGIARLVNDPKTGKTTIDKRDERGRTIDVHALRTTFGTHLSRGGVAPAPPRPPCGAATSSSRWVIYTDLKLLDVRGALDVLPDLPLGDIPHAEAAKATGTGGAALACALALQSGKMSASAGIRDHQSHFGAGEAQRCVSAVSGVSVNRNGSQSTCDHEPLLVVGVTGFEPATSWSRTKRSKPS